jgi:hypothetical protein
VQTRTHAMKLWYLIILCGAFCVGAASFAAAATLSVSSKGLAGGNAAVAACDTDGVRFSARTVDATTNHGVTSLTVSSIASACAGSTLTVTLTGSTNTALDTASATLPATGFTGAATLTLSGSAPAASITNYRAAIVGS